jgi:hypothetical protein
MHITELISVLILLILAALGAIAQPSTKVDADILSGACAFDEKRYNDALPFFLQAQRRGVADPNLSIYIARAIDARYKNDDRSPANLAIAREAIAAYEPLLDHREFADEAVWAVTSHHLEVNADRAESIAADESTHKRVRARIYGQLASKAGSCASDIAARPANQRKVRVGGVLKTIYKMPPLRSDFEKARKCVADGLAFVDKAIALEPANLQLWSTKRFLLMSQSNINEMAGDAAGKAAGEKASDAARDEYRRLEKLENEARDKRDAAELAAIKSAPDAGPKQLQRFVESGLLRQEPGDFIRELMTKPISFVIPPSPSVEREEKAEATRRAAKRAWTRFAPAGSRFSLLAPSPMETDSMLSGVTIHRVTSENVDYQIMTMPIPAETPLVDPRAIIATAAWASTGTLCNFANMANYICEVKFVRELTLAGKPGREYSITQTKCSSRIPGVLKVYMTGANLVLIQAIRADETDPNVKRLFDSLTLN